VTEESESGPATPPRSALPPSDDLARRVSGVPFLLALDIDGTLAPIAPRPEDAAVPAETRRTLERLASMPDLQLALVTGRAAADGRRMVDIPRTWTIGNHGIEVIDPAGALRVEASATTAAPTIAEAVQRLAAPLAGVEGVLIEDKTWTLSVHVRLATRADVPYVERTLVDIARSLGLRVLHGKEIFELRPTIEINKGTALVALATALGVGGQSDAPGGSLLYAGDDRTDEDAFRALRELQWNAVTVHVGPPVFPNGRPTEAEFVLEDPVALHDLLQWLASRREQLQSPRA
jgi:trehalose-phosphatase